ncbi:MAG TPA: molybdopterin-dependent oxidoreductase [Terriglobia bacterium]|nr:molybdopterin-dependent oxidoreductase [Terriglobia bacterium]
MSRIFTRRGFIKTAAGLTLGASGIGAAAVLANRYGLAPPDGSGLFGVEHTLTYASQRLLLRGQPLAREFGREMISKNFPAINTVLPEDDDYRSDMSGGFRKWRLAIDGMVARPMEFSLDDLRRYPSRTQVTQHVCEQGWSAIAEWTGVPLSLVLDAVGISPQAKFVFFICVDGWWDSLDMADALHPQTLLTYGMNGADLPVPHGAPVRLRVERQIGYKNLKYLSSITVADSAAEWGEGKGSQGAEHGYSWYAGI